MACISSRWHLQPLAELTGKTIQRNLILGFFLSTKSLVCVGIGGKSSVNELACVEEKCQSGVDSLCFLVKKVGIFEFLDVISSLSNILWCC